MGLGINYVILANHMVSLITSSTTNQLTSIRFKVPVAARGSTHVYV